MSLLGLDDLLKKKAVSLWGLRWHGGSSVTLVPTQSAGERTFVVLGL